ncbi:uncharacterized protein B4U79_05892, partial [Dinothrombium tinctorium]
MGCGAAKATQTNEHITSNHGKEAKIERKIIDESKHDSNRPSTPVPKPVAFEITTAENGESGKNEESIVKKHPPKRLQRLEEQAPNILTVKDLAEKQQKAEERRQNILEERVNKSRSFQQKFLEKSEK